MKRQILHSKRILSRSPAAISHKKTQQEVKRIRLVRLLWTNPRWKLRQTLALAQRLVHQQTARLTSMWYRQAMVILSSQSLRWLIKLHRLSLRPPGSPWCQEIPSRILTRMMTRLMRALRYLWQVDVAKLSKLASPNRQSIISSPNGNTYRRPPRRSFPRVIMEEVLEESYP